MDPFHMQAEAAIEKLMALHPKGFDLSLDRISELVSRLGDPHLRIPPAFHVAGTNGKGSATAFIRALLEAQGRTVHVHTSPHLVNWNERYRLGDFREIDGKLASRGRLVDDETFAEAIERVAQANNGRKITVFEIMSAVGFLLFSEHEADFSVLEVGLGGRFDATNVIPEPLISVIMPIGLDHVAYLGDTIAKIAFEKAGIIKPGRPVVCGYQADEARDVIEKISEDRGCPIMIAGQDFTHAIQSGRFIYQDEDGLLDLPMPRLAGMHQLENAATAIAAVRMAARQGGTGINLTNSTVENAMLNVEWPGRFEPLKPGRLTETLPGPCRKALDIRIDGGHNPHAGVAVAQELAALDERSPMPVYMIAGMINTKDPKGYFEAFEGIVRKVWTVPVTDSDAGVPPEALAEIVKSAGLVCGISTTVEEAMKAVCADLAKNGGGPVRLLISGSLYLIGEVLRDNGTPPD